MPEPDITDGTVCVFIDAIVDNDSDLVLYVSVQTLMYLNPVKR